MAVGAVALWASLAPLGVALSHVPPFLLTGLALLAGGIVALPFNGLRPAAWRVSWPLLALGVYGLFGFHFLLFISLRLAPPVEANLVNYLWPLGIVVMAPVFLKGTRWRWRFALAALIGFVGAATAILSGDVNTDTTHDQAWLGYGLALGSAWIWSSYSLLTKRAGHLHVGAIGTFCLVSGLLALLAHGILENPVHLQMTDMTLIALLGLGPLGGAFYLWHIALQNADARRVGLIAFATPVLSTVALLVQNQDALRPAIGIATALVVLAAWLGSSAQE